MNTSKQINVMIGLLFLAFVGFSAYMVTEPQRQANAREAQLETSVNRGASLFVNNCRTCHGMVGLGGEEGALAPALNSNAYLILGEDNEYGLPATPEGEAQAIRDFVFNSIACGRVNSAMPVWLERYGGPLSETQVNYLVALITTGGWDVVDHLGHEHDVETGDDASTIILPPAQAGTLALTTGNCGQYQGAVAAEFRNRDPFADPSEPGGGTAEPEIPDDPNAATEVQGALVGTFFSQNCAVCHGQNREGLVGPALTPVTLTEADDVYVNIISNGVAGTAMPSWSAAGLTDEEITNLVNFLKNVE
ncbi:MAG: c-type cytochrome, partial [Dehalococcoidia bacterium]